MFLYPEFPREGGPAHREAINLLRPILQQVWEKDQAADAARLPQLLLQEARAPQLRAHPPLLLRGPDPRHIQLQQAGGTVPQALHGLHQEGHLRQWTQYQVQARWDQQTAYREEGAEETDDAIVSDRGQ